MFQTSHLNYATHSQRAHIVDPLAVEARAVFKQHSIYKHAHALSQQRITDIVFACHHFEEASRRMGDTERSTAFVNWVGTMKKKWDEVCTIAMEGNLDREADLESALQSIADHGAALNTAFSFSGVSDADRKLRQIAPQGSKHRTTFGGDPGDSRSNSTTPDRFYPKSARLDQYRETLRKSVCQELRQHDSDTIKKTTESQSKAMQMVNELRARGILRMNEKPDQDLLWLLERDSAMKLKADVLAASQAAEEDDEEEEDDEDEEEEGEAEQDEEEAGEARSSEEEPSADEEESGDEKPKPSLYAMGGLTRKREYT